MSERKGLITFAGNPLTLTGNPVDKGDAAPDFTVLDNDLAPKSLKDFDEKVLILVAVPSLDTSVCSLEAKRFNDEAAKLDSNIKILTISMDLPFAQKRWADEHEATRITTLSDHRDASFGEAYGIIIKELRLLARTIFILDSSRTIQYIQLVSEVTNEPDYNEALSAAQGLL